MEDIHVYKVLKLRSYLWKGVNSWLGQCRPRCAVELPVVKEGGLLLYLRDSAGRKTDICTRTLRKVPLLLDNHVCDLNAVPLSCTWQM